MIINQESDPKLLKYKRKMNFPPMLRDKRSQGCILLSQTYFSRWIDNNEQWKLFSFFLKNTWCEDWTNLYRTTAMMNTVWPLKIKTLMLWLKIKRRKNNKICNNELEHEFMQFYCSYKQLLLCWKLCNLSVNIEHSHVYISSWAGITYCKYRISNFAIHSGG